MLQHLTHILLDAARMESDMEVARELNKAHDSLYRGTSSENLAGVAPYLFEFSKATAFADWYLQQGWGRSWGVLLKSALPLQELHKHFRKFLMVRTEAGKQLYFRFYDPRVLRIFLPTCDATQIREFFGPIDYFLVEDEDPAFAFRCWQENGVLKMLRMKVDTSIQLSQHAVPGPPAPEPAPDRNAGAATPPPSPGHDTTVRPEPDPPLPPKPKTRWNMFD